MTLFTGYNEAGQGNGGSRPVPAYVAKGLIGLLILAVGGGGAHFVTRPTQEGFTLGERLEIQDISRTTNAATAKRSEAAIEENRKLLSQILQRLARIEEQVR